MIKRFEQYKSDPLDDEIPVIWDFSSQMNRIRKQLDDQFKLIAQEYNLDYEQADNRFIFNYKKPIIFPNLILFLELTLEDKIQIQAYHNGSTLSKNFEKLEDIIEFLQEKFNI